MSRNYVAIHYIQEHLKDFNTKFVDCVVRCFNHIEQSREPDGCLSNTVALYICAKEFGYNPNICYGLCVLDDKEFYHAWLEIDNIIIDMAIYGNVNFSQYSMWDFKLDTPYVGTYEDADISYGRFVFDDDWAGTMISVVEGWSLDKYMNTLPRNAMWKIVCKFLDKTPTLSLVKHLEVYIDGIRFERNL